MNTKIAAVAVAFLALSGAAIAQGSAPFCVVTGSYTQCHYRDAPSCRRDAASAGGMCVLNQQQAPATQPSSILDNMRHIQESGERGREAGMAAREHAARMQAIQAPARAAEVSESPIGSDYPRVTYSCTGSEGETYQTVNVPILGCTVSNIEF